jgi:hypothetical protein
MSQNQLVQADPTRGVKVNAADIAQPFRDEIQRRVNALLAKGEGTTLDCQVVCMGEFVAQKAHSLLAEAPLLVGLLANDDPAAVQYADWTGKACRSDGLRYELRKVDRMDVEQALQVLAVATNNLSYAVDEYLSSHNTFCLTRKPTKILAFTV